MYIVSARMTRYFMTIAVVSVLPLPRLPARLYQIQNIRYFRIGVGIDISDSKYTILECSSWASISRTTDLYR